MTPDADRSLLRDAAAVYGIALTDDAIERLFHYRDLAADWSTRINLVSRRDLDRFLTYHLLDSLKCAPFLGIHVRRLFDFGAGAGLPGIPLAIAFPDIAITLLESRLKRIMFLEHAVRELSLGTVRVVRSRAEDLPPSENRQYDVVVTRATVSLAAFFTTCRRFTTRTGRLLSIKGEDISEELAALRAAVDPSVFNISVARPPIVPGVRTGTIVTVSPVSY